MPKMSYEEKLEEQLEDVQERFRILWDMFVNLGKNYPGIIKSPQVFQSILSIEEVIDYVKSSKEWNVTTTNHLEYTSYKCQYLLPGQSGNFVYFEVAKETTMKGRAKDLFESKRRVETAKLLEFIVNQKVKESDELNKLEVLIEFAYDIKANKGDSNGR